MNTEVIELNRVPQIGDEMCIQEKQGGGVSLQVIGSRRPIRIGGKDDYRLTFIGVPGYYYFSLLMPIQNELKARLKGPDPSKSLLPPLQNGIEIYVPESDPGFNRTGRVTIDTLDSQMKTKTNGGDWLLGFKNRTEKHLFSVIYPKQAELENQFQQQMLEDEVQAAISTAEPSRLSASASG